LVWLLFMTAIPIAYSKQFDHLKSLEYLKPDSSENTNNNFPNNITKNITNTNYLEKSKFWARNLFSDVRCDFSIFFGKENLPYLAGVLLLDAFMANTGVDRSLRNFWQKDIRTGQTDAFFKAPSAIGRFNYVAIYLGTMTIGYWKGEPFETNAFYTWGYRSLRTLFLVGIQESFYSWALSNGRPSFHEGSKWQFFKRNGGKAGCSGHAFNGAIPFLTAAMMSEEPVLRYGLYVASVLPALSRINRDHHYPSQVMLGWALAYLSAKAIYNSDNSCEESVKICVVPRKNGAMLHASLQY